MDVPEWMHHTTTIYFVTIEWDEGNEIITKSKMFKNEDEVDVFLSRYRGYSNVSITAKSFDDPTER